MHASITGIHPPYVEARFWPKVAIGNAHDCWEWQAFVRPDGYGHFWIPARKLMIGSHRVAYELAVGPIPEGLQLDHLCRNTRCCNPAHLEPVTQAENARRSIPRCAKLTHCKRGHPLSGSNVHVNPKGQRICRTCKREGQRRIRARTAA